jgi:hypothetical protein
MCPGFRVIPQLNQYVNTYHIINTHIIAPSPLVDAGDSLHLSTRKTSTTPFSEQRLEVFTFALRDISLITSQPTSCKDYPLSVFRERLFSIFGRLLYISGERLLRKLHAEETRDALDIEMKK